MCDGSRAILFQMMVEAPSAQAESDMSSNVVPVREDVGTQALEIPSPMVSSI
jgi:hypothetical protein